MSENLTLKLFDILESRILSDYYDDEYYLKEKDISEEFNVSRTPVREALQLLESNYLIKHSGSNKGYMVCKLNTDDMVNIYDLREILESFSAKLCAKNISEEKLLQLNEILILEEFYIKNYNLEKIVYYDNKFHNTIHSQSNNIFLERMLNQLHHYTMHYREKSYKSKERAELSFYEHKQIFLAIQSKDSLSSENMMARHINNAKEYMIKTTG